ncbi:MAG: prepilin peptidase [Deltaproteobacteria bacterium]|nr:prepilin peptidase [Deltaproteobacteria bacterium]
MEMLVLVFIFGLLIGSFLNVCIWRMPRDLSVIRPYRSFCPKCNTQLSALENIPIVSWFFLRGRCKSCHNPISGRYPLVEFLSGIFAALSFINFGLTLTALVIYIYAASLIVITFIDLDFKIIPDAISLSGIVIGLIIGAVNGFYPGIFVAPISQSALSSLFGVLVGAGLPLAIFYGYYLCTKKEGLGMGDVKLLGLIGALFGWQAAIATIFIGSFFGAIFGIGLMVFGSAGRNTEIPFGPWLALGALLHLFLPEYFVIFSMTL